MTLLECEACGIPVDARTESERELEELRLLVESQEKRIVRLRSQRDAAINEARRLRGMGALAALKGKALERFARSLGELETDRYSLYMLHESIARGMPSMRLKVARAQRTLRERARRWEKLRQRWMPVARQLASAPVRQIAEGGRLVPKEGVVPSDFRVRIARLAPVEPPTFAAPRVTREAA